MATRIRLKRMGSKKAPFYRVVVANSSSPRDGRFIDGLGFYNPIKEDLQVDEEKALKWLQDGAQPSETVRALFKKTGILQKFNQAKTSR